MSKKQSKPEIKHLWKLRYITGETNVPFSANFVWEDEEGTRFNVFCSKGHYIRYFEHFGDLKGICDICANKSKVYSYAYVQKSYGDFRMSVDDAVVYLCKLTKEVDYKFKPSLKQLYELKGLIEARDKMESADDAVAKTDEREETDNERMNLLRTAIHKCHLALAELEPLNRLDPPTAYRNISECLRLLEVEYRREHDKMYGEGWV